MTAAAWARPVQSPGEAPKHASIRPASLVVLLYKMQRHSCTIVLHKHRTPLHGDRRQSVWLYIWFPALLCVSPCDFCDKNKPVALVTMRENRGAIAELALPVPGSEHCGNICRQTCAVSVLMKFLGGLQRWSS